MEPWDVIILPPQTAVLSGSDAGSYGVSSSKIKFRHPKPSELVLHVVPDLWGKLLGNGLQFVQ